MIVYVDLIEKISKDLVILIEDNVSIEVKDKDL